LAPARRHQLPSRWTGEHDDQYADNDRDDHHDDTNCDDDQLATTGPATITLADV
jgi:hypothetical protein